MSKELIATLITAAISSILFLLVFQLGLGFLFFLLPTIPIFTVGLGRSPKIALEASFLGAIPIAIQTSTISAPLIYLLVFALPSWMICRQLIRYQDLKISDEMPILRLWYPAGLVMVSLAVYSCSVLAIITALYSFQETNLPNHLASEVKVIMQEVEKELEIPIENPSPEYLAVMMCGFIAWMWAIGLYAHGIMANFALLYKRIAIRPSLAIHPFPVPNWLLTLIGISALASIIGGESMRFLGKSSVIILIMPYFFQGLALIHIYSHKWPNRKFLLGLIYASILIRFWAIFIIAGVGIWQHAKLLNKLLSADKNSSKS